MILWLPVRVVNQLLGVVLFYFRPAIGNKHHVGIPGAHLVAGIHARAVGFIVKHPNHYQGLMLFIRFDESDRAVLHLTRTECLSVDVVQLFDFEGSFPSDR